MWPRFNAASWAAGADRTKANELAMMSSNGDTPPSNPDPFFQDRTAAGEKTLALRWLKIERKEFTLALCDNARGRFLRLTEQSAGKRKSIILPASGLEEFRRLVAKMASSDDEPPPQINLS